MADRIHRVTMFKLPQAEDRAKLMEQYKVLATSATKDGKPYILSLVVGPADDDARNQGYTLVNKTEFASMQDMKYYDDECQAHADLKAVAKGLAVDGILTVYFRPQVVAP